MSFEKKTEKSVSTYSNNKLVIIKENFKCKIFTLGELIIQKKIRKVAYYRKKETINIIIYPSIEISLKTML